MLYSWALAGEQEGDGVKENEIEAEGEDSEWEADDKKKNVKNETWIEVRMQRWREEEKKLILETGSWWLKQEDGGNLWKTDR